VTALGVTQILAWGLTAWFLVTPRFKPLLHYAPVSVLFCIIILNVAANQRSLLKMENRLFMFLGNISYAIYMFHEIAIKLVMEVQTRFDRTSFTSLASNAVLYFGSIVLTLLLASAVYRFYELWFLRLKSRFTIVPSGVDAGTGEVPGAAVRVRSVNMDFRYGVAFGSGGPSAYERLLLDALLGDSTLFTRSDEVEAATPEPEWPPEETAAAAGAGAAAAIPAEVEAETPTDDSAWPVAGAAAGAAGRAGGEPCLRASSPVAGATSSRPTA